MPSQGGVEPIENDPRSNPDGSPLRVEVRNGLVALRQIDDEARSHRAAGKPGAGSARRDFDPGIGRCGEQSCGFLPARGKRDRLGLDFVDRRIGGVKHAGQSIGAKLTPGRLERALLRGRKTRGH